MRFIRLVLIIAGGAALLSAQVIPVYQVVVGSDPVSVNVSVLDSAGRAVSGLTKDDFTVFEDDESQTIGDVKAVGVPYNMLVLVDRSVRDKKSPWGGLILSSVDRLFKTLRGPDRLAVGTFDTRVSVVLDWRTLRSDKHDDVVILPSDRSTLFYDAIDWSLQEMRSIKGRRGVIVYTDGRDKSMYPKMIMINGLLTPDPNYSVPKAAQERFEETLAAVKDSQIPFYFVAVDTDRQQGTDSATAKLFGWETFLSKVRSQMEQLAAASGGTVVYPKKIQDVQPMYTQIQDDLGSSYIVSYTPAKPAGDNKYRRIEVRLVNRPSQQACVITDATCTVNVRARAENLQLSQSQQGYYAR